jgi:hypothetical protein
VSNTGGTINVESTSCNLKACWRLVPKPSTRQASVQMAGVVLSSPSLESLNKWSKASSTFAGWQPSASPCRCHAPRFHTWPFSVCLASQHSRSHWKLIWLLRLSGAQRGKRQAPPAGRVRFVHGQGSRDAQSRAVSLKNGSTQRQTRGMTGRREHPSLRLREDGIRRNCERFNGSTQPKDVDAPHSHRKLSRVSD